MISISIDEIKALAEQCDNLIAETEETDTLRSYARRCEFRNLRSVLSMLLQYEGFFYDIQIKNAFQKTRKRISDMISNPQSAGYHDHMLRMEEK